MQGYCTQHKCVAWSMRIKSTDQNELLKHRTDLPPGVVPDWAVALTCGVDTQKRGFWYVVLAWGIDLTSHLVMYGY